MRTKARAFWAGARSAPYAAPLFDAVYRVGRSLNACFALSTYANYRRFDCRQLAFNKRSDRLTNVRAVALHSVGHPSDVGLQQQR